LQQDAPSQQAADCAWLRLRAHEHAGNDLLLSAEEVRDGSCQLLGCPGAPRAAPRS